MSYFKANHLHPLYRVIVIGGSAGSFQVISNILSHLPKDFEIPIVLCLHRLRHVRNGFVEALNIKSTIPIQEPLDKAGIRRQSIYLAPANYHLSLELGNTFALTTEELLNNSRPSIDITLQSASYVYRNKAIGILLSGANRDGAYGMKKIHDNGGLTIIQDPEECLIDTMPTAALNMTKIDYILKVPKIVGFLQELNQVTKRGLE